MKSIVMSVGAVAVTLPGFANAAAWLSQPPLAKPFAPEAAILPAAVRRRTTLQTRAAAEVFGQVLADSGADPRTISTVFGSAWGETSALLDILKQMHSDDGAVSPIRFAGSVHNTAAGLLSIATENHGFTTSVAAGHHTVAMALVECAGLLATGTPEVIVVFSDIDPPTPLADRSAHCVPFAVAIALHLHDKLPARPSLAQLSNLRHGSGDTRTLGAFSADLSANPCASALLLASAILRGQGGVVAVSADREWTVEVSRVVK